MSPASVADTISLVTKQYTIYGYGTVLLLGLFGNISNVIIFSTLKVFQRNQCAFYIIVESICNFALLILALPFRVAEYAFAYDATRLSLVWCKLRPLISHTLALMAFSAICCAAVDQYLSTNHHSWLRKLSNFKSARRVIYSLLVIWTLYDAMFLIFFEIQSKSGCTVYNTVFARYYSFGHYIVLNGLLPILISGMFSAFAYLNVRRIVRLRLALTRRKLDKQLTAMILAKVTFLVVTIFPSVVFRIYILNSNDNPQDLVRVAIDQLVSSFAYSLFYINSAVRSTLRRICSLALCSRARSMYFYSFHPDFVDN